jgi:four helix bundle protein
LVEWLIIELVVNSQKVFLEIVKSYSDLKIWQKVIVLVKEIYLMCKEPASEELYSLQSPFRASVSLPSNIAEGQGRNSTKRFIQFIKIAWVPILELDSQATITFELDFISKEKSLEILELN